MNEEQKELQEWVTSLLCPDEPGGPGISPCALQSGPEDLLSRCDMFMVARSLPESDGLPRQMAGEIAALAILCRLPDNSFLSPEISRGFLENIEWFDRTSHREKLEVLAGGVEILRRRVVFEQIRSDDCLVIEWLWESWGEILPDLLSSQTGCSIGSVFRLFHGEGPSKGPEPALSARELFRAQYALQEVAGMSSEQAVDWLLEEPEGRKPAVDLLGDPGRLARLVAESFPEAELWIRCA